MIRILASVALGWSLGSNDAANVFGTAVSSSMVRWRTAAVLIAVFVLIGALVGGREGMETYAGIAAQTSNSAFCIALAAAITVTLMTVTRIPVSTSQAVVGAIVGAGLVQVPGGAAALDFGVLRKLVLCWLGTPAGAAACVIVLYPLCSVAIRALRLHFIVYDRLMRTLLVLAGIYGAYALGANNVANVTGVFYMTGAFGPDGDMALRLALCVGGLSIGLGALTFSRPVMLTVGRKLVSLDAFSAFVVVLSEALVVHIFSVIGAPVSTSQAIVGAVLGVGLLKGVRAIRVSTALLIVLGWILTPVIGLTCAYLLYSLF